MVKFWIMIQALFLIFSSLILTLHAQDTSTEVQNKAYWLCKAKGDVRTIRVHVTKDGICITSYSKMGTEKTVGSTKYGDNCLNILNNIKTNLEKSKWVCRDITDTKMTASLE